MISDLLHSVSAYIQAVTSAGAAGFAGLTVMQIFIGLGVGVAGIFLIKVVLTPGGPRGRMQRSAAPWFVVPFLIAIGGAIVWVVVTVFKGMGTGVSGA